MKRLVSSGDHKKQKNRRKQQQKVYVLNNNYHQRMPPGVRNHDPGGDHRRPADNQSLASLPRDMEEMCRVLQTSNPDFKRRNLRSIMQSSENVLALISDDDSDSLRSGEESPGGIVFRAQKGHQSNNQGKDNGVMNQSRVKPSMEKTNTLPSANHMPARQTDNSQRSLGGSKRTQSLPRNNKVGSSANTPTPPSVQQKSSLKKPQQGTPVMPPPHAGTPGACPNIAVAIVEAINQNRKIARAVSFNDVPMVEEFVSVDALKGKNKNSKRKSFDSLLAKAGLFKSFSSNNDDANNSVKRSQSKKFSQNTLNAVAESPMEYSEAKNGRHKGESPRDSNRRRDGHFSSSRSSRPSHRDMKSSFSSSGAQSIVSYASSGGFRKYQHSSRQDLNEDDPERRHSNCGVANCPLGAEAHNQKMRESHSGSRPSPRRNSKNSSGKDYLRHIKSQKKRLSYKLDGNDSEAFRDELSERLKELEGCGDKSDTDNEVTKYVASAPHPSTRYQQVTGHRDGDARPVTTAFNAPEQQAVQPPVSSMPKHILSGPIMPPNFSLPENRGQTAHAQQPRAHHVMDGSHHRNGEYFQHVANSCQPDGRAGVLPVESRTVERSHTPGVDDVRESARRLTLESRTGTGLTEHQLDRKGEADDIGQHRESDKQRTNSDEDEIYSPGSDLDYTKLVDTIIRKGSFDGLLWTRDPGSRKASLTSAEPTPRSLGLRKASLPSTELIPRSLVSRKASLPCSESAYRELSARNASLPSSESAFRDLNLRKASLPTSESAFKDSSSRKGSLPRTESASSNLNSRKASLTDTESTFPPGQMLKSSSAANFEALKARCNSQTIYEHQNVDHNPQANFEPPQSKFISPAMVDNYHYKLNPQSKSSLELHKASIGLYNTHDHHQAKLIPHSTFDLYKADVSPHIISDHYQTKHGHQSNFDLHKASISPKPMANHHQSQFSPQSSFELHRANISPQPISDHHPTHFGTESSVDLHKTSISPPMRSEYHPKKFSPQCSYEMPKSDIVVQYRHGDHEVSHKGSYEVQQANINPHSSHEHHQRKFSPQNSYEFNKPNLGPLSSHIHHQAKFSPQSGFEACKTNITPQFRPDHHQTKVTSQNSYELHYGSMSSQSSHEYPQRNFSPQSSFEAQNSHSSPQSSFIYHQKKYSPQNSYELQKANFSPQNISNHHQEKFSPQSSYELHKASTSPHSGFSHHEPRFSPQSSYEVHNPNINALSNTEHYPTKISPQTWIGLQETKVGPHADFDTNQTGRSPHTIWDHHPPRFSPLAIVEDNELTHGTQPSFDHHQNSLSPKTSLEDPRKKLIQQTIYEHQQFNPQTSIDHQQKKPCPQSGLEAHLKTLGPQPSLQAYQNREVNLNDQEGPSAKKSVIINNVIHTEV